MTLGNHENLNERLGDVIDGATRFAAGMSGRTREIADAVDPFIKGRPYSAILLAGAVGVFAGLLMAESRPKIIYVKSRE